MEREKMQFKTIAELVAAVKDGRIDEKKLHVVLDNDVTSFYLGDEDDTEIEVQECNGYMDIEPLYKLLFPQAMVEWC